MSNIIFFLSQTDFGKKKRGIVYKMGVESLADFLIGNREFFTSLGTAPLQDLAPSLGFHSFTKAMFIFSATSVRLVRSFHSLLLFLKDNKMEKVPLILIKKNILTDG